MDATGALEAVEASPEDPEAELKKQQKLKRLRNKLTEGRYPVKTPRLHDPLLEGEIGKNLSEGSNMATGEITANLDISNLDTRSKEAELNGNPESFSSICEPNVEKILTDTILEKYSTASSPAKNSEAETQEPYSDLNYTVTHSTACPSYSEPVPTVSRQDFGIPGIMFQNDGKCKFFPMTCHSQEFLVSNKVVDITGSISIIQNHTAVFPLDFTQLTEIHDRLNSETPPLPNSDLVENLPLASDAEQDDSPATISITEYLKFILEEEVDNLPQLLWDGKQNQIISTEKEAERVGKVLVKLAYGINPSCQTYIEDKRSVFSQLGLQHGPSLIPMVDCEVIKFIVDYIEERCKKKLTIRPKRKGTFTPAELAVHAGIRALIQNARRVTNGKDLRKPGGGRVPVQKKPTGE